MIDIQELKAKAEAATIGEWTSYESHSTVTVKCGEGLVTTRFMAEYNDPEDFRNGEYIAAANPQAILELIAKLERCRTTLGFAASVIKSGESWSPTCEQMFNEALKDTP